MKRTTDSDLAILALVLCAFFVAAFPGCSTVESDKRVIIEADAITPKFTRPYRPQPKGKVERFHRILLEE